MKDKPPVANLSVAQLIAAYEKDEESATKLYEGNTIFVSGVPIHSAVIRDTKGINLKTDDPESQWKVMCLIYRPDEPDAESKLKIGKDTKFIGTVERIEEDTFIHITNCRFAE